MASIFSKINSAAPGVLRPIARARTKLQGFHPLLEIKKFGARSVQNLRTMGVKVRSFMGDTFRNTRFIRLRRMNKMDDLVVKNILDRKVRATDIEGLFSSGAKSAVTKESAERAMELADRLQEMAVALKGEVQTAASKRNERTQLQFKAIDVDFEDAMREVESSAWRDFTQFLVSKDNVSIYKAQSLHQMIEGTGKLPGDRMAGLKDFVQKASQEKTPEDDRTVMEKALFNMYTSWATRADDVKARRQAIVQDKTTASRHARELQHLIAYDETMKTLRSLIENKSKRDQFVGSFGELVGIEGGITAEAESVTNFIDSVDTGYLSTDFTRMPPPYQSVGGQGGVKYPLPEYTPFDSEVDPLKDKLDMEEQGYVPPTRKVPLEDEVMPINEDEPPPYSPGPDLLSEKRKLDTEFPPPEPPVKKEDDDDEPLLHP